MALLALSDVSVSVGDRVLMQGVEFDLEAGARLLVQGPEGAGKSALLDAIGGQRRPACGSVTFDGRELVGLAAHEIVQLGIARVFQRPSLFWDLTVAENVTVSTLAVRDGIYRSNLLESPRAYCDACEQAERELAEVGLERHLRAPAGALSVGDMQRLELAICLAHRPRLVLFDGLGDGSAAILDLLADRGMAVIVTARVGDDPGPWPGDSMTIERRQLVRSGSTAKRRPHADSTRGFLNA